MHLLLCIFINIDLEATDDKISSCRKKSKKIINFNNFKCFNNIISNNSLTNYTNELDKNIGH